MLEKEFFHFLKTRCSEGPILLGFSGGSDSTVLFHLLLRAKKPFACAHIDHGWRPESGKEAGYLEKICSEHKVPFYLKKLTGNVAEKNLEDCARQERFHFFQKICEEKNFSGVMLGHHSDDQAETVLKRLFEGSSLHKLRGLQGVSQKNGLTIYRPLLVFRKKMLSAWLESQNISFFIDSTNEDERFLRARLRKRLLPELSENFGKEITPSLCRIGKQAAELNEFIESHIEEYRLQVYREEGRVFLDLRGKAPAFAFLWKAVIRDFLDSLQLCPTDAVVETVIHHLQKKTAGKMLRIGKRSVKLDRGLLSISQTNDFD